MLSLQVLRHSHSCILLLDAASARIQVGAFVRGETDAWATADEEAGQGLFRCIEKLAVNLPKVEAFVFCEGPGSLLGVRTSAMAIRTWQVAFPRPTYSYRSLELVAYALDRTDVTVIADARRDSWHSVQLNHEQAETPVRRVATHELPGSLVTPEHFRSWSIAPAGLEQTSYVLRDLLPKVEKRLLFRPASTPDAFMHESPNYITWSPHVHRAAT